MVDNLSSRAVKGTIGQSHFTLTSSERILNGEVAQLPAADGPIGG